MNLGSILGAFGGPIAICYAITCLLVGVGVLVDSRRVQETGRLKILSPEVWALVCVFGFVPGLALYWAAHHSTLSK